MNKSLEKILNWMNMFTMLRLALIPGWVVAYYYGFQNWALAVFLIASLTDLLDGQIARKYHMVTNFGKDMDPFADKLICIVVLYSFASANIVRWVPLIIVITKELVMLIGSICLLRKGVVVQSRLVGKIAQRLFFAALGLSFFYNFFATRIMP